MSESTLTLEEADTVMRELGLEPMPGSPFKTPYEWYQRLAVQLQRRHKDHEVYLTALQNTFNERAEL